MPKQYVASFALTLRPRGGWKHLHKARLEYWLDKYASRWEFWVEEVADEECSRHIHGAVQLKNKCTRFDFIKESLIKALGLSKDERRVALNGIKDLYDVEWLDTYASKGGVLETAKESDEDWLFADPGMKLVKNKNVQIHDMLSVLWPQLDQFPDEQRRMLSLQELQGLITSAAAKDLLKMPNRNQLRNQADVLQMYLQNGGVFEPNARQAKTVTDAANQMDEEVYGESK